MGRVATLVKSENQMDRVYGVAYEIERDQMDKTFQYLNFREKCGYSLKEVMFYPLDKSISNNQAIICVCYLANEQNPYYSPQTDLALVSHQIFQTRGPSGENREYLYMLCKALRELVNQHFQSDYENIKGMLKYDEHLFELERMVLGFESKTTEERSID